MGNTTKHYSPGGIPITPGGKRLAARTASGLA